MAKEEQKNRSPRNWPKLLGWTVVPALLLAAWQISAGHLQQPWIFPPVSSVVKQLLHPLRQHYASGSLSMNTLVSLLRVLIGFTLAALVGIPLGVLMGSVRTVRGLIEPLVELLRPLCPIAWLPFAIAVFKLKTVPQLFGVRFSHTIFDQLQLGMIFVLFWGGFFPILVNTPA